MRTEPARGGTLAEGNITTRAFVELVLSLSLSLGLALASQPSRAATLPTAFAETQLAGGLSSPTAMAFAPDGRLFVTTQGGELRVIKGGQLLAQPFVAVSVDASGERGLLGVAFDPDFASNNFVYIYYTAPSTPAATAHNRISRFVANGDVAAPGSETVQVELDDLSAATNHNGGAIHFGADGKLYIATGENANGANAQTLTNRLGKLLRINADGTIPSDNPFFNEAVGANRAIWALGLRNPFTFAFQPGSGRMFINDVGQSSFEEVNDGVARANYGWPETEGPTTDPRFRAPLFAYGSGNGPTEGCAIAGGTFYNPPVAQFPASFAGQYFFADLCSGWIRRLDPANPGSALLFATDIAFPVDLQVGPDGALYYLARGNGLAAGGVFRIRSTVSEPTTVQFSAAAYAATESAGSATITVTRNGSAAGAVSVDYRSADGSAVAGSDYTAVSGTATFAPGDAVPKTFSVPVTNDATVESDETVQLILSHTNGAAIGEPGSATLTIASDDVAEGGGGGGCAIGRNDGRDASLASLALFAVFALFGIRRASRTVQRSAQRFAGSR
ncbi:MAG: PQQ-dependent sugar dehydrogenase [Burkholderiales bacterium]|nr:PQQ-dependent sugar dehydrogenase [Burkholderiales bacterium]